MRYHAACRKRARCQTMSRASSASSARTECACHRPGRAPRGAARRREAALRAGAVEAPAVRTLLEQLDAKIAQLELTLEDLEASQAARPAPVVTPVVAPAAKPVRRPLPAHLPREERRHEPEGCACPACGGALHAIGEDVNEVLEYEPAQFTVIRHVRPRFACRACESIHQTPMPSLPIERGRPGPGLLAQVLIAKYCDHLPLYRQSAIYARGGVELDRSTLADWVGRATWLLQPLVDRLAAHVFAAAKVHADDTPVPVLDPGRGPHQDRAAVGLRPRRPARRAMPSPPAAAFFYSPDRKGERPAGHLAGFSGFLQADAYAGFDRLYGERIARSAVGRTPGARSSRSTTAPVADRRRGPGGIGALYRIETAIRGRPPDRDWTRGAPGARGPRARRRSTSGSTPQLPKLPPKSGLARWRSATRSTQLGGADPLRRRRPAGDRQQPRPKTPCAASPSAARTGCSPAPTPAASAPRRSTA